MKLKLKHGDNYHFNHPEHGFGKVRNGGIIDVADNYGKTLLEEGEQIRDDLFVGRFEEVVEAVAAPVAEAKAEAKAKATPRRKKTTD